MNRCPVTVLVRFDQSAMCCMPEQVSAGRLSIGLLFNVKGGAERCTCLWLSDTKNTVGLFCCVR